MISYEAIIAYDGTPYFGWQKTQGPSIQEELEKALYQLTGETVLPEAASRTDRGVHAKAQVVQFALSEEQPKLLSGLNALLPKTIRVLSVRKRDFHPTLDAVGKEYHYQICQGLSQEPHLRLYSWHVHHPLDRALMERASQDLLGTHDFSAFANEKEENPFCTLECVTFDGTFFRIRGNRFLYKMVRNLVGTLIYIGCGKLPADAIPSILASKKRRSAGVTAPAHGLCLHQVFYSVE